MQAFERVFSGLAAVAIGTVVLSISPVPSDADQQPDVQSTTTQPSVVKQSQSPVSPQRTNGSEPETRPAETGDLRTFIGVNPGLKRADMTRFPTMSLRGFVKLKGLPPMALLEIAELKRNFLVQAGTEIPVTVQGRVSPVGRSELTGLNNPNKTQAASARPVDANEQSQIVLKVVRVSNEGVTVEAGLLDQTITVR